MSDNKELTNHDSAINNDFSFSEKSGPFYFIVFLIASLVSLYSIYHAWDVESLAIGITGCCFAILFILLTFSSYVILGPNETLTISFFGKYKGTYHTQGFSFFNPFYSTNSVKVGINTLSTKQSKINDKDGTPLLVNLVVNWKVKESGKFVYNSEKPKEYVENVSESVLRTIINQHYYDSNDENEDTLSKNSAKFSTEIVKMLNDSLQNIGVTVLNANIANISYAPEIAGAMLQRQQAKKTGESRKEIVDAAVNTVTDAITKLETSSHVKFNDDEKKKLLKDLMVVIVSDQQVTPVINLSE